jgi:ArsR family transcriptional regulator
MRKPTADELELLHSELCSVLSDPTRIAILYELADGPRNVTSIVEALGIHQATVSRHLRILRERNLARTERDGNQVFYELVEPRVLDVLTLMREVLTDILRERGEKARRIVAAAGRRKPSRRSA